MEKRVVIGLSGGVDSAVSAYLLKQAGYEVVGVTFKTLPDFDSGSARKVCEDLNIEFHEIDIVNEFKEQVINVFNQAYLNGLTPNPCVLCNKEIKFKYLYDAMLKFNCEYLATGHYARVQDGKIYKSYDLNKDQSYFLGKINKNIIPHILFPLEGIDKEEVRKIAAQIGLSNAEAKDSYDVCFIKNKFTNYIKENLGENSGKVILLDNNQVIGTHHGLSYYTIGQRRGLNIGGFAKPLFVAGKNIADNILYVASGSDNKALISNNCIITDVNLLTDIKDTSYMARFRYRQKDMPVKLELIDDHTIKVLYDNISTVTPGQTCVIYNNDMLIGAGTISEVYQDNTKIWYL